MMPAAFKRILQDKIARPVLNLLKQGITPEKLALSVACGALIGIFPIIGATTLICAAMALVLRLNLPAIQLANYLVYPLQLLLIIPFIGLGAFLFQVPSPPLAAEEWRILFQQDFWGTIGSFFDFILYAIVAWFLFCVPVFPALYFGLVPVFRKVKFVLERP